MLKGFLTLQLQSGDLKIDKKKLYSKILLQIFAFSLPQSLLKLSFPLLDPSQKRLLPTGTIQLEN